MVFMWCIIDVMISVSCVFFFKQKTAYGVRISDWSSDVCASDLNAVPDARGAVVRRHADRPGIVPQPAVDQFGEGKAGMAADHAVDAIAEQVEFARLRSEARRVGRECGSKCRSRWSTYHYKNKSRPV